MSFNSNSLSWSAQNHLLAHNLLLNGLIFDAKEPIPLNFNASFFAVDNTNQQEGALMLKNYFEAQQSHRLAFSIDPLALDD